jgi:Fe-S-cluster containining protein
MGGAGRRGVQIEIQTPEGTLRGGLALPDAPLRLAELAWNTMFISEKLVDLAVRREAAEGRTVSCQKGCGACCRQIVPLSPPEAWMIADVVAALPPERRSEALAVFARAGEALDTSGLRPRLLGRIDTAEKMVGLAIEYFRLGVPCPFLRDESCSIYPYRPSMCREYLVTSPAERCGTLGRAPVARIPVHVRLSEALAALAGKLLGREPEVVPLTVALEWAVEHAEEGRRTWDAQLLLEGLVAELSPKPAGHPSSGG